MSRKVTINDVAHQAGVSKVTVSYVLNGRSAEARISASTQAKVISTAKELGFRANAIARSLSRRRTDMIGVVFQSGSYFSAWSSFTSEVMRGVSEKCFELGYDVMLHTKGVSSEAEEAFTLADGRVDGVLILRDENDETLKTLAQSQLPVVQFFTHCKDLSVPSVDLDNRLGGRLATEHLLSEGHRRIALVCGSPHSVSSIERVAGYKQALRDFGIEPREDWIISQTDYNTDSRRILEVIKAPDAPTGLFVWSDDIAFNIMRDLRNAGVNIPQDLSVVGFDSLPNAAHSVPALTSVRQPVRTMAAKATEMLIHRIQGHILEEPQVFFSPTLDVRASTTPFIHSQRSEFS